MSDESLWDAMERLRISTIGGLDRLDAHVEKIKDLGAAHECPWVGECRCVQDGSLCGCLHQHGEHGAAPLEYDGACTRCSCTGFDQIPGDPS
jgi:hypothetical protein